MSAVSQNTPTIDEVAATLPPIVRALATIAESLEVVVTVACRATNLPEDTADLLNDAGQSLIAHSRVLMQEANERCRNGPGRVSLLPGPAVSPVIR